VALSAQVLRTYLHLSGIEKGYSYFAPNIPRSYDLAFDVYLSDGHVEHVPIVFGGTEESLRWFSLMDYVGRRSTGRMREVVLKRLANSIRQQYPEATGTRAIIGTTVLPSVEEFRQGRRESHRILAEYSFSFSATERPRSM
jgi:hypothetical protein